MSAQAGNVEDGPIREQAIVADSASPEASSPPELVVPDAGLEASLAPGTPQASIEPRPLADAEQRPLTLSEALVRLEDTVRTRLAEADRAGSFIDRLEAEVRRLKQREDERRLEPAVKGIIALFDQVALVASDVRARQQDMTGAERELARTIVALQQQVLELLDGLGATALVPETASRFDGQRQEVISTVETPDEEKHLTVASVRRPGFEFAGRVCRPAAVQVFCYTDHIQSQAKERVS